LLAYILYGLFILACAVLIVVILLQPGKADAGALFTSSVSSTAFGPRGTANLLAKITIGAAAAFMLIALTLSLPGVTDRVPCSSRVRCLCRRPCLRLQWRRLAFPRRPHHRQRRMTRARNQRRRRLQVRRRRSRPRRRTNRKKNTRTKNTRKKK